MKKVVAVRAALCVGAAAMLVAGASVANSSATGVCSETSLAGISLSLEQYIQSVDVTKVQSTARVMAASTLLSDEVTTGNTADETEPIQEVSKYENMGISVANDYVNIRKKPDTESEILGKLYRGAAATIVKTDGDWVKIKSGSVTGYIKSEFLAIGYDAEELEDKFGTKWATVTTTTLKVREEKSTDSIVLGLIPIGEKYEVIKEYDDWVKILVDDGDEGDESTKGYVSKEFVDISVEFEEAISVAEEEAELKRQEEALKAETERLQALEEQKRQQQASSQQSSSKGSSSNSGSSNSSSNNSGSSNSGNSSSGSSNSGSSTPATDATVSSGDGAEVAGYAQKFVGNPYVYGGTSLTNGTDCSGFTMSLYSHFGISIPRTSRSQATSGKSVSFDNLKAGDLIFYASNGTVNHVAMYIGGGQVVHASSRKTGIKISTWNYRTPYTARRVVE